MRRLLVIVLWIGLTKAQDIPFAIVGGGNSQGYGYAGVLGPHSTTAPEMIRLPPETPSIRTVAINNNGTSLVGCGNGSGNSYIARIAPGSLVPQALDFPANPVRSVAINDREVGFAGCGEFGDGYAARILPNSVTPQQITLPVDTNGIRRVAINSAGAAIIGGCNQLIVNSGYAAYISPGATNPQQIAGNENINYVAINACGAGLIGGGSTSSYAAFVAPNSTILQQINLPIGTPPIYGVALNRAGAGLIGASGGGVGYAASVTLGSPYPQPIAIPANTPIWGVAINSAGMGIIGGGNTNGYAALIAPDGTIKLLNLPATQCPMLDVAINDQGVGLIGGEDLTGAHTYAALVAPDGTLTPLLIPAENGVNFVAINNAFVSSVGPYTSAINTLLAVTYALEPRLNQFNGPCAEDTHCSLWIAPFGNYIRSKKTATIPTFTNKIGGFLVALDRFENNFLVGGGLGYASNAICYEQHLGCGHLGEELACLYSAVKRDHIMIEAALWGGPYQIHHDRRMLSSLSAKAHFHGWVFAPQIKIALPFRLNTHCNCSVEPFVMLDWINNWQDCFKEAGSSGFNLTIGALHRSLLYSEAGICFYQNVACNSGRWALEEKLSYVNESPSHDGKTTTYFAVPTSPFTITTNSTCTHNLCGVELTGSFSPDRSSELYGTLSFQGLFGREYRSYFANITVGKNF